jgi:hypothetical protein
MKAHLLLASLLALPVLSIHVHADEEGDDEVAALAHRYGMDHFDRIDSLKFTFNVREGTSTVTRHWEWDIAGGKVSLVTGDKRPMHHTYSRSDMAAGKAALNRQVDGWFVADREWLLLPLKFVTDHGAEITLDEDQPLPVPPGTSDCVTVEYADNGDAYEIYFDEDRVIRQSVFRKGESAAPAEIATWTDLVRIGPILVSLRHKSADGRKEIWYSDVEARIQGSRRWLRTTPAS